MVASHAHKTNPSTLWSIAAKRNEICLAHPRPSESCNWMSLPHRLWFSRIEQKGEARAARRRLISSSSGCRRSSLGRQETLSQAAPARRFQLFLNGKFRVSDWTDIEVIARVPELSGFGE